MKAMSYIQVRNAIAYFYLCPGLAYGVFTSRLPALRLQTMANDYQIGLILFFLGLASLTGLVSSGWLILRWGSRNILRTGSMALLIGIGFCGLAKSPFVLGCICVFAGLGLGIANVAQNVQAIRLEAFYGINCMSFMHACYSLGGVIGAIAGSLFASLDICPLINSLCVLGVYAALRPIAVPWLLSDMDQKEFAKRSPGLFKNVPIFVVICGILALFTYVVEGSVGEWGSIFLVTIKDTEQSIAALVFAAFSSTTVCCRLYADRLRTYVGDFNLCFFGSLIAGLAMILVLTSDNSIICLLGYSLMGGSLAPIVPIFFSRAGSYPGINSAQASSIVSILAYGGLLFFPPLIGFGAYSFGLENILISIPILCAGVALGSLMILRK